ncbi:hypothetical protein CYMTET_52913 [Cymbomonas tetramitiformis]|uniref:Uncharacterized protein n=1 Tax=Cymbomonas tetramitiformis TaxID=36881 RepID=A0AAE0EQK7_9CHLO|nr:hypothetical protein CYMTET_52913 [Cymbomonas tetramitiformis]
MVADEMAVDEIAADEIAADEIAADEIAADEMTADTDADDAGALYQVPFVVAVCAHGILSAGVPVGKDRVVRVGHVARREQTLYTRHWYTFAKKDDVLLLKAVLEFPELLESLLRHTHVPRQWEGEQRKRGSGEGERGGGEGGAGTGGGVLSWGGGSGVEWGAVGLYAGEVGVYAGEARGLCGGEVRSVKATRSTRSGLGVKSILGIPSKTPVRLSSFITSM